ncbi:putative plant lipid transfer protein/Par allergen [Rosa chinensis]|uniref:Putative plant lipid transfer protein/Par allergen n=1 Tax=Rosa chinensis TaxID=74649 RepID=A0A2P6QN18_ROSCH|nr:non-specific lipid transfer protein GPI-anchored 6 [Rosa chinensis]PRQ35581.1 putative plant lipid transfer protein/Par allergen [Rosa chinensis]
MSNSEKFSVGISCIFVVVMMLAGFGSSDIDQDRAQCADQLIGLAPCLPYVGGEKDAKTPTIDCCTGLKQVDAKSHRCLCVLIKDHNDPKLGLNINATLALMLPGACHVPVNITSCVDLLHLDPKSADGKMFLGYAEKTKAVNSTSAPISSGNSTSSGTVSQEMSDGWSLGKGLMGIEMLFVISMCFYISHLVFYV